MKDLTPIDEHDVLLQQKEARRKAGLDTTPEYKRHQEQLALRQQLAQDYQDTFTAGEGVQDQAALRDLMGLGHSWGVNERLSLTTEDRMERKRQRYEKCCPIANEILEEARASLAVRFRFLDRALCRMPLVPSFDIFGMCSDGIKMYYDPEYVVDRFKLSPNEVVRDVIHCLFHCIFRHPFMLYSVMREPWDVACDIAIESMLIDLVGETFPSNYDGRCSRALKIIRAQVGGVITAERLYHFFSNEGNRADLRSLAPMFRHDSHGLWYADDYTGEGKGAASVARRQTEEHEGGELNTTQGMTPEQMRDMINSMQGNNAGDNDSQQQQQFSDNEYEEEVKHPEKNEELEASSGDEMTEEDLAASWEELAEQMQIEIEATIAERGDEAGNLIAQLKAVNREKQNYEAFLKRFAVLRERMMVNDDEFDYIYYTFGMERYGNMPLIEPLEYKDARGIHDFVIAIDTSESCSGEMVQAFVRKTYNILCQSESFHSRVNIHIIQCDAKIQSDKKIESLDDLDLYLKDMELRGFGGTDFRPVFEYVNLLCEKGEFTDLRGMVYFTDGQGLFPRKQPKYDTVFVFLDDGYSDPEVPPWALKLILDERELEVSEAKAANMHIKRKPVERSLVSYLQ